MTMQDTHVTPQATREPGPGGAHRGGSPRVRLLAGVLVVLALTGCYLLDPDLLPEGTDQVSLEVGETAQVDLGTWSPGVGDDWGVVPPEVDGAVEAQVVMNSEVFGVREGRDEPGTGGSFPYSVELTGIEPGTSTVRVIFCYRSKIMEDCDQGPREIDPIEITVTVT